MIRLERVVHHILLMLVNFLPVNVNSLLDHTFVSSCDNESGDVTDMGAYVDDYTSDSSPGDVLNVDSEPEYANSFHLQSLTEMSSEHNCTNASSAVAQSTITHSIHCVHSDNSYNVRIEVQNAPYAPLQRKIFPSWK